MNKILDVLINNDIVFFGILIGLGVVLVVLVLLLKKKKKKKIPIYEEDLDKKELEKVKDKDIIDAPTKKEEEIVEEEIVDEEEENIEESLEEEEIEELTTSVEEPFEEIENEEEEEEETTESKVENLDLDARLDAILNSKSDEAEVIEEEYTEERKAELENIDEEEIKERIEKEHEEAVEEALEEIDNDEMTEALKSLKEAKEMKPEDVVRQFEQEQEAQSIISYQELVDVVKNRDNNFEDELESKPLATVSDFLPEGKKDTTEQEDAMLKLIEELGHPKEEKEAKTSNALFEEIVEDDEIEELTPVEEEPKEIPNDGKFKKTEVISPVFGRIPEESEESYVTVKKFNREEEKPLSEEIELPGEEKNDNINPEAEETELFEDISEELEEEPVALFEEIPVDEEEEETTEVGNITKNEEFLKALKNFRDSL